MTGSSLACCAKGEGSRRAGGQVISRDGGSGWNRRVTILLALWPGALQRPVRNRSELSKLQRKDDGNKIRSFN